MNGYRRRREARARWNDNTADVIRYEDDAGTKRALTREDYVRGVLRAKPGTRRALIHRMFDYRQRTGRNYGSGFGPTRPIRRAKDTPP